MKKLLLAFGLIISSLHAYSQNGYSSVFLRVTDSATFVNSANTTAKHAANYADIWYSVSSGLFWKWSTVTNTYTMISEGGLPAQYTIDQATPSTAGGTITLDMNSQIQRSHVGSATFAAAKIVALSNTTNSLFFNFFFEVTNVAAVITAPADWMMSTVDFDGADWTPPATGKFLFGGQFDDVNNIWYVTVAGPFN